MAQSLADFVGQHCIPRKGYKTKFSIAYDAFQRYLHPGERIRWNKRKFANGLAALGYKRGLSCGQVWVCNLIGPETHEYRVDEKRSLRKEPLAV